MRAAYEERSRLMMRALDRMGLSYGRPGGAYDIYAKVSTAGMSASDFCLGLLQEERVMIFSGTLFGDKSDQYIRIGLVQPDEIIEQAADRIERFITRQIAG
jgi:aminotransferase